MKTIDINCDLGEGIGNDALLMPYISSCSIACGGHFGTRSTLLTALTQAQAHRVNVGAHPSYPDRTAFGRRSLSMGREDFKNAMRQQLDLFFDLAAEVHHIKPHGALYNDLSTDTTKGRWLLEVIAEYKPGIKLYCSPGSTFSRLAQQKGFIVIFEGFGDRLYTPSGQLVDRSIKGSVFQSESQIANQICGLVNDGKVITQEGISLSMEVQTICLHSDTPELSAMMPSLMQRLNENKINVAAV